MQNLKSILPKTLLNRSLMIVILPLIILQFILSYVFFERHTETILKNISENLAGNVEFISQWYDEKRDSEWIKTQAFKNMNLVVAEKKNQHLSSTGQYRSGWLYKPLVFALRATLTKPYFIRLTPDDVIISFQQKDNIIDVYMQRKRFFSRTTPLVLILTSIAAALLSLISFLFMRNQIRPIIRLAESADLYGRGYDNEDLFKPEGALEVKKVGFAFLRMKKRLNRLLNERLEMLAGVSHDLRTPITRLKLASAMLPEGDLKNQISHDVQTVHTMIEEFIHFARGSQYEALQKTNLTPFIQSIVNHFDQQKINFISPEDCWIEIKRTSINRCLTNIIVNSFRYANNLWIKVSLLHHHVLINCDDDGPGIPIEEREKVFQPFYRLDAARNLDTPGVGLGLSIARDLVYAHGGDIRLDNSPHGGLRVQITLPC